MMRNEGLDDSILTRFDKPPQRVVSLVPSLTESLFDLKIGDSLVGITDFCVHPEDQLKELPRVGSTKKPSISEIIALQPDLVIANQEENPLQIVNTLEKENIPVWVTFPKTVRQALRVLWTLATLFECPAAITCLDTLEKSLDWTVAAIATLPRKTHYFCPIWQEMTQNSLTWWMTFNCDTYMNDLLDLFGGENIFRTRERQYPLEADLGLQASEEPGERDIRYPRVTKEEICRGNPEIILLPDEPYSFGESNHDRFYEIFAHTQAVRTGNVHLVDGSLIT